LLIYMQVLKQNVAVYASEESRKMTLSEKYQLSENIRVLRLLLPVVISHTSITIAGAAGFFYFELAGFEKELYPIFEDTINMVYLQGIALPLIFFFRHRSLIRSKRLMLNRIFTTNMSTGEDLITVYDRAITRGW
ncbi:hypothetical protein PENTCL1PPCAC_678, partial [Pristionchus entomophagus]